MIEVNFSDISHWTGAKTVVVPDNASELYSGCYIDSRHVSEKSIFVAIVGERVDGHSYIETALKNGARCIITTQALTDEQLQCIKAYGASCARAENDDYEEFMLRLAGAWRKKMPWSVVGITGSVGKTTTKDMVAAALATKYKVYKTQANHNNLLGVPLTLMQADNDCDIVVVEMGMNHPTEIARLSMCALPQVGVITNVGTSHIGLLGSRENIARAKAEMIDNICAYPQAHIAVDPCLFMSSDNDFTPFIIDTFLQDKSLSYRLCGSASNADIRVDNITLDSDSLPRFTVIENGTKACEQTLKFTGRHVVFDYALAFGVARQYGIATEQIHKALAALESVHMRQEVVHATSGARVIDDSYNASPDSIAAALKVLCAMACTGRRIAVLGEIGELGEKSEQMHGFVGAYASALPLDMLVLVGTQRADYMEQAARIMGFSEDKLVRVKDPHEAARLLKPILTQDDIVLAKASRAANLDIFVKEV